MAAHDFDEAMEEISRREREEQDPAWKDARIAQQAEEIERLRATLQTAPTIHDVEKGYRERDEAREEVARAQTRLRSVSADLDEALTERDAHIAELEALLHECIEGESPEVPEGISLFYKIYRVLEGGA